MSAEDDLKCKKLEYILSITIELIELSDILNNKVLTHLLCMARMEIELLIGSASNIDCESIE